METTTLIIIVSAVLLLTLVLRFILRPQVRRSSPRKRYTVFAALLGAVLATQWAGFFVALVMQEYGLASLFMTTLVLLGTGCTLEMRKLRKEF